MSINWGSVSSFLSLQHQIVVGGLEDQKKYFFWNFLHFISVPKFFPPFPSFFNGFPRFFSEESSNQSKFYGDIFICLQAIRFIGSDLVNQPPWNGSTEREIPRPNFKFLEFQETFFVYQSMYTSIHPKNNIRTAYKKIQPSSIYEKVILPSIQKQMYISIWKFVN